MLGDTASPGRTGGRAGMARRVGWWAVLGAVLFGHAVATLWLQANVVGWGDGDKPMPPRIDVVFVHALAPAAPPAVAPVVVRAAKKAARVRAPEPAASAPTVEAPVPAPETPPVAVAEAIAAPQATPEVTAAASAPSAADPAAAAPTAVAAASVASATVAAFEWPPSTRLSYTLSGNYRGEVHGTARVQWVRLGERYQVHLDVAIGPGFAPLIVRRMTSDGELGEQGLVPGRYDETTRVAFQQPRRATILFSAEHVTLANGSQHQALPGVQDAASQFVQLTWLFTTQPALLRAGNTVTVPLALPRRMGRWVYDVLGQERLATPVGELDTFHLKPRLGERRPSNELSAEIWFAPTLQYLPVRIRIEQEAGTFVDLMLDAAPLQAAPPEVASAPR